MVARITDAEEVTQFREIAQQACTTIRDHPRFTLRPFLLAIYRQLLLLCHRATLLPDIGRFEPFRDRYTEHAWRRVYLSLQRYLARYDRYRMVYDPFDSTPGDTCVGSLADDLSGILADLQPGLKAWEGTDAATRRGIVWSWRVGFDHHWGMHAHQAVHVLHWMLHNYDSCTEDENLPELQIDESGR